ncbi:MAG: VWA domain-containing protein [Desulfobacterales bacterium]|nr:VWA domain-containing protein [Desulfobacterales bacterium]
MKNIMCKILFWLALCPIITDLPAWSIETCLEDRFWNHVEIKEVIQEKGGSPLIYTINKSGIPFYKHSSGFEQTSVDKIQLGEIYFGASEEHDRILLGKYNQLEKCFTRIDGWVLKDDLVIGRKPVRVWEAIEKGLELSDASDGKDEKKKNHLYLKVLAKPEFKFEPRSKPGNKASKLEEKSGGRLVWKYVYDMKKIKEQVEKKEVEKWWYLVGVGSDLFLVPHVQDTSSFAEEARKRLLGWIPEDQVMPWVSNVVMEYNTEKDAVVDRLECDNPSALYKIDLSKLRDKGVPDEVVRKIGGDVTKPNVFKLKTEWNALSEEYPMIRGYSQKIGCPAVMYMEKREGSQIKAREMLKQLWKPEDKSFKLTTDFDPTGLSKEYPRYHVVEEYEDGWIKVASLGSLTGTLSETEIARLIRGAQSASDNLRSVDLVFVIDATGSMRNEIKQVHQFLEDFVIQISSKYKEVSVSLPAGITDKQIDTSLLINVSLVLYQDIHPRGNTYKTNILFRRLTLPGQLVDIKSKLKNIQLGGGEEALHDGLLTALNTANLWSGEYSQRIIVLIADEPGDAGGATQAQVLSAMPLPIEKLKELKFDTAKVKKTDYTRLWAIYTENRRYDHFKQNVSSLTAPNRIIHIADFERRSGMQKLVRDELYAVLVDIGKIVNNRVKLLSNIIRDGLPKEDKIKDSPTMLDHVAIEAALERTGMNLEELSVISEVAFVDGYVKEKYLYHKYPTFRRRIMIEEEKLMLLKRTVKDFALYLKEALDSQDAQKSEPAQIVGYAMLYAIAMVVGDYDIIDKLEGKPSIRKKAINEWWKTGETSNKTVAELIKAPDFLPLSKKGIFGVTCEELKKWDYDKLRTENNILLQKSHCMELIIADKTIPNVCEKCLTWTGKTKRWRYQPPNSNAKYIYFPESMIP